MKKLYKKTIKLLCLVLSCLILVQSNYISALAEDYWPGGVDVVAQSAIVMELETGTILYEKNINEELYPASITKIMTALVVLENCELDEIVTFSEEAVYKNENGTSSIARDVGEEMTVEETLYGMMLESANECAWALGEHVAGDMDTFVQMMNDKATELGCKNTHFNNPNGLPDTEHWTSAYDMALISSAAFKIPKFAEIVGTKSYTIPPTNKHSDSTPLNNHHCMLHYYKTNQYLYEYCLGGKTGYTNDAGSTLVTYAKKDNMTLVCVVMKDQAPAHWTDTASLFDYCFDNFAIYNVADFASISEDDTDIKGLLSESDDLIKIDEGGKIVVPKTASVLDAKSTVTPYTDEEKPHVVGKLEYSYAGRDVGYANLLFTSTDEESYPFDNISVENGGSGKEYIQVDYPKIGLIILAIIAVILLIVYLKSKESDFLLFRHRLKSKKPSKPKTNFRQIRRQSAKRRKRRR